jgi:hypothetical protein
MAYSLLAHNPLNVICTCEWVKYSPMALFREGGVYRTWFRRNMTQVYVVLLYHTWCLKSHEWEMWDVGKGFGYFGGEQCVLYEHTKRKKYFQILENLKICHYPSNHSNFCLPNVRLKFVFFFFFFPTMPNNSATYMNNFGNSLKYSNWS